MQVSFLILSALKKNINFPNRIFFQSYDFTISDLSQYIKSYSVARYGFVNTHINWNGLKCELGSE